LGFLLFYFYGKYCVGIHNFGDAVVNKISERYIFITLSEVLFFYPMNFDFYVRDIFIKTEITDTEVH